MDRKILPEEKLELIEIINHITTEKELKEKIATYFTSTKKESLPPSIEKDYSAITLETAPKQGASIYSAEYIPLVEEDNRNHPRTLQKLTMEVPEESLEVQPNSTFETEQQQIEKSKERPKILEKKLPNNPWADSGIKTVSPGEIKL